MLAGETLIEACSSQVGPRAENESRFGAKAHESSSFSAGMAMGLSPGLYWKFGCEMPLAEHKAVDGCESLRTRLFAAQAEPDSVLSLGKPQRPQVVPGHETGVMRAVGGDVGPLLCPGYISFRPLLCSVLLGDCVGVEFDPAGTVDRIQEPTARIGAEPESVFARSSVP